MAPVDQHHVGSPADLKRADLIAECGGPGTAHRCHAEYLRRGRHLVIHAGHAMGAQHHAHLLQHVAIVVDAAATAAAIEAVGGRAVPLALDVRDQDSVEAALTKAVEPFGRLDVLVNNAGIPMTRPAVDITRAEWEAALAVNLTGTFFMCQQMGRHLIGTGRPGAIVSLASTHGTVGFPNVVGYGVAKAGISHMTRILAIEWAPHNIRVNAIAPGTTETPSRAPRLADPARRETMLKRIPLGRFGNAEEMAAAVSYLVSPEASYITGQILLLDGGLTAY